MDERTVPTAQEKSCCQHRNGKHVDVLSQKKECKLHSTVLGVKAGHELRLCFREIERHAVRLGYCRDQIDQKTEGLDPQDVPATDTQVSRLLFDDALEIECPGL